MKKFLIAGLFVVGVGALAVVGARSEAQQPQAVEADPTPMSAPAPAQAKSSTRTLLAADDGKTIQVKAGETISIKLDSNASTGYSWKVTGISSASAAQNGKIEYEAPPQPKTGPIRVGQGSTAVIKIDAVSAGKSTISLEYARPWEKGKAPAKTFTITLDIK